MLRLFERKLMPRLFYRTWLPILLALACQAEIAYAATTVTWMPSIKTYYPLKDVVWNDAFNFNTKFQNPQALCQATGNWYFGGQGEFVKMTVVTPIRNLCHFIYQGSPSSFNIYAHGRCNPGGDGQIAGTQTCINYSCPAGWTANGYATCFQYVTAASTPELRGGSQCQGGNATSPASPNPITLVSGNKSLSETDVPAAVLGGLKLGRNYNSQTGYRSVAVGANWKLSLDRALSIDNTDKITAYRESGRHVVFARSGDVFKPGVGGAERIYRIPSTGTLTGWRYIDAGGGLIENYDATGQLVGIIDPRGQQWSIVRDGVVIASVANAYGVTVTLGYDDDYRVNKLGLPGGGEIAYGYDAIGNLVSVTYPDGKSKSYHYENGTFPNALTGISDENGTRTITYSYDSQGRAYDEVMNGGVAHYQLSFGTDSTAVTDPLGSVRTYNFQNVLGVMKSKGVSQPGGAGCGAANANQTYDANGNVASRTDFNGAITTYAYDPMRSLEIQRVEASGKPEARTISTQWHAYWNFPVKVAEPKKLTTYVYNGDNGAFCAPQTATVPSAAGGTVPIAVLCSKTVQATTDANGSSGFSAGLSGKPRTWTWTYNAVGQVLTADGPRSDVPDTVTYAYYATDDADQAKRGNQASTTNALGHVTLISAYDPNGRPLTIVDANGVTTTLSYTPRGWLKTRTVSGAGGVLPETTSYDYDDAGQMVKVTQPDGSYLAYTYDGAHRLIRITDNLGNTINYTLDAIGNRANEEIKDPGNTLTRKITREYDALNRLKTITGALQ